MIRHDDPEERRIRKLDSDDEARDCPQLFPPLQRMQWRANKLNTRLQKEAEILGELMGVCRRRQERLSRQSRLLRDYERRLHSAAVVLTLFGAVILACMLLVVGTIQEGLR